MLGRSSFGLNSLDGDALCRLLVKDCIEELKKDHQKYWPEAPTPVHLNIITQLSQTVRVAVISTIPDLNAFPESS